MKSVKYLKVIYLCVSAHLPSQSNLVAIHEIMKQQLEFTRNFCESQKYLYHSLVEALRPDYVYTTLEATKEVSQKTYASDHSLVTMIYFHSETENLFFLGLEILSLGNKSIFISE